MKRNSYLLSYSFACRGLNRGWRKKTILVRFSNFIVAGCPGKENTDPKGFGPAAVVGQKGLDEGGKNWVKSSAPLVTREAEKLVKRKKSQISKDARKADMGRGHLVD